jgi:DNA polymerase
MVKMDWKDLEEGCKECNKCSLCNTRNNIVIGRGNKNADLMFVGEAPGENEDLEGRPFVGAAGKLLDKYLLAVDFPDDSYYICNILKCRPPNNRNPLPEEIQACMGFLREQTKLVKPKIIVCLGKVAASTIIKPDFSMTREHGKWFKKGNFLMCGIYHPSAILRDTTKRQVMFEDLESIFERLKDLDQ